MTGTGLKKRRLALGLTQEQLARKLDVVSSTIARWEQLRAGDLPQGRLLTLALNELEHELSIEKKSKNVKSL